jgi:iron complex outermembrane receptor protein
LKKLFVALSALLLPFLAAAQFSVSGKVTDASTGETLPGANITIENSALTTVTDVGGAYRFSNLTPGNYTLKVSYIGYAQLKKTVNVKADVTLKLLLSKSNLITDEVTVRALRASGKTASTYTNLKKADLAKNNFGQDLPYLLNQTPSVVITSDAGTGIGYTGIRIRGSDGTRTNVTINGIPINDAEDQGAYFVDLPDLVSSVDNIQIQRGVGTSTNGAGAFGASINMQTTTRRDTAYAELNNSAGSFGTVKNTVNLGTGLIDGKFSFDGRLSRIQSDGYIDRGASHLKSYFLTGAYYGKNTLLRVNVFSGYEQTYQSWYGVPEDTLQTHRTYNYYTYKNQTDNYNQDYYQLLLNQKITSDLSFNGALFYTKGYGYYEEYQPMQALAKYGVTPVTVGGVKQDTTDLVRRLWLNNDFYGITYALNYNPAKWVDATLGGAYNIYKGAHYNNIEWTQQATNIPPDYEYSRNNANKKDFNIFAKADFTIGKVIFYADMQYRHLDYSFLGIDENYNNVQQQVNLDFYNPKLGITYLFDQRNNLYASFSVGNHEPNRSDYIAAKPSNRPLPEGLKDFELGYRTTQGIFTGGINGFYMLYKNQLVLTGQLNDVGEAIRTNVPHSYRSGVEFDGKLKLTKQLNLAATASLSENKIKNFTGVYANYDNGGSVSQQYYNTDIAYSPSFISSGELAYAPFAGSEIALVSKYVSRQYLDNTSNTNPANVPASNPNSNRYIDGYFVSNVRLHYNIKTKAIKNIGVGLLVNNFFNKLYQTNGATYPDIEGGAVVNYDYYYPQATRNFLASLNLSF